MTGLISCTLDCNLACQYCFEGNGDKKCYPNINNINRRFADAIPTIIKFIDELYEYNSKMRTPIIWHGGEPTLIRADLLQEVMSDQREKKHNIRWQIQTNGTLLTDEYINILKEYEVRVSISLDGMKEQHDKYRVMKNGNPTFDIIQDNIQRLKNKEVPCSVLVTVTDSNVSYLSEIYDYLVSKNLNFGFNALYPTSNSVTVDLKVEEFADSICKLFDKWINDDKSSNVISAFIQIIEGILHPEYGIPACNWQKNCSQSFVAMDCDGYLYPCEHWVDNLDMCMGHIKNGLIQTIESSNIFAQRVDYLLQDDECRECEIYKLCYGGCPWNGHKLTGNYNAKDESICYGRKRIIQYIYQYLQANSICNVPDYSCFKR